MFQVQGEARTSFVSKLLEDGCTPETEEVVKWAAMSLYAGEYLGLLVCRHVRHIHYGVCLGGSDTVIPSSYCLTFSQETHTVSIPDSCFHGDVLPRHVHSPPRPARCTGRVGQCHRQRSTSLHI